MTSFEPIMGAYTVLNHMATKIPPTPDGKKLLNYRQAAKALGLSEERTRTLVASQRLKAINLGAETMLFRKCDVDRCKQRLESESNWVDSQFTNSISQNGVEFREAAEQTRC
jgi:excisionase family DNA binding protein